MANGTSGKPTSQPPSGTTVPTGDTGPVQASSRALERRPKRSREPTLLGLPLEPKSETSTSSESDTGFEDDFTDPGPSEQGWGPAQTPLPAPTATDPTPTPAPGARPSGYRDRATGTQRKAEPASPPSTSHATGPLRDPTHATKETPLPIQAPSSREAKSASAVVRDRAGTKPTALPESRGYGVRPAPEELPKIVLRRDESDPFQGPPTVEERIDAFAPTEVTFHGAEERERAAASPETTLAEDASQLPKDDEANTFVSELPDIEPGGALDVSGSLPLPPDPAPDAAPKEEKRFEPPRTAGGTKESVIAKANRLAEERRSEARKSGATLDASSRSLARTSDPGETKKPEPKKADIAKKPDAKSEGRKPDTVEAKKADKPSGDRGTDPKLRKKQERTEAKPSDRKSVRPESSKGPRSDAKSTRPGPEASKSGRISTPSRTSGLENGRISTTPREGAAAPVAPKPLSVRPPANLTSGPRPSVPASPVASSTPPAALLPAPASPAPRASSLLQESVEQEVPVDDGKPNLARRKAQREMPKSLSSPPPRHTPAQGVDAVDAAPVSPPPDLGPSLSFLAPALPTSESSERPDASEPSYVGVGHGFADEEDELERSQMRREKARTFATVLLVCGALAAVAVVVAIVSLVVSSFSDPPAPPPPLPLPTPAVLGDTPPTPVTAPPDPTLAHAPPEPTEALPVEAAPVEDAPEPVAAPEPAADTLALPEIPANIARLAASRRSREGRKLLQSASRSMRRRDYGRAERALLDAYRYEPESSEVAHAIAIVKLRTDDTRQAALWARRATQLDEDDADHFLLLGDILGTMGERDAARAAWQEALRLDPRNRAARRRLD